MSPLILTGLDRELDYIIILEPQRTLINNTVREPQTEGGGGQQVDGREGEGWN